MLESNLERLAPAVIRALREAEQQRERAAQRARIERLTRILEMLSGINTAVVRIRERLNLLGEVAANLSFALQYFEKESAVQ